MIWIYIPIMRGKEILKEGLLPLLNTPWGVGLFSHGIKRGFAPLRNSLPSPLMKGRGIKGEGLADDDKGKEEI